MGYNIIHDYGLTDPASTDISVHYYWALAVYNLKYPATFKRSKDVLLATNTQNGASFSDDITKGVTLKSSPLIIIDDCQSVNVSSSKSNHVGVLSSVLYPGQEYLSLIMPGDYVFCWMVNSKQALEDLVSNLKSNKPANTFNSGLKFYGKVTSIREQTVQAPDGHRQARFLLNANSFTELDATFFYEIHLSLDKPGIATQLEQLGFDLNTIVDTQEGQLGLVPNRMIAGLIDVYLGKGIKQNLESGFTDTELKSTFGTAGEHAHIVPASIGNVLNKTVKSGSTLRTADILEVVHGVQHYSFSSANLNLEDIKNYFNPDNTFTTDSRRFTGQDLLGRNSPIPPELINQSLWSVLYNYLNPSCNELYATLRVNPSGNITPTVIARQMPFTTEAYNGDLFNTKFSSLPRWILPPVIVKQTDIGRSDGLRVNYIKVYGTSDTADARSIVKQMEAAPPRYDEMDIARSGLRPYMTTVPCYVSETQQDNGPKKWMEIIADFMIGQHMTLTGQITTSGIQSPICVGDNLEWDGVIYHIEGVVHSCSISEDGHKQFTTNLSLTNGVRPDSFNKDGTTDLSLYARTSLNEAGYLPKTNTESDLASLQTFNNESVE